MAVDVADDLTAPAAFRCRRCGNCCRHEGIVRLREREPEQIAESLGLSVYEFTGRYTRLVPGHRILSLTEKDDGSCVFLSPGNDCLIQDAKPYQCRSFPQNWKLPEMMKNCKGMNEHE